MAKQKVVQIIIKLTDRVSGVLGKIRGGLRLTGQAMVGLGKIGVAAFAGIGVAAAALGTTIKAAFKFETLRTQIKVLVGSAEEARRVFNDLKEFSASTPFELPGIIEAWQQLKTFTEGALNTRKGLELVGDAAAARGKDFSEVAFWVGRLYSAMKNGDPILDSVGALQRLGILGGEARGTLTRLTESGAEFSDMWGVVEKDLLRFNGGMKELSTTGGGLISTLKDNWTIAVATFGEAFMDAAKGGITTMINTIKGLVDDGTITKWANQAKEALDLVIQTAQILAKGGEGRSAVLRSLGNVLKQAFKAAALTAAEVLMKVAPKIGASIGKGVLDLIGITRLPKDIREQKSELALSKEALISMKGSGATDTGRFSPVALIEKSIANLEKSIAEGTKAWEEGRIELDAADFEGAVREYQSVIDNFSKESEPSKVRALMEKAIAKGMEIGQKKLDKILGKDLPKAVKDGTENGAEKGTREGTEEAAKKLSNTVTPEKLSEGISAGGGAATGAAALIEELMSGKNGMSRREALGTARGFVGEGGSGSLDEVAKLIKEFTSGKDGLSQDAAIDAVMRMVEGGGVDELGKIAPLFNELTQGQTALGPEEAIAVIKGLLDKGDLGDPKELADLIDILSRGQDKLSKEEIGAEISKLFGTVLPAEDTLKGGGVIGAVKDGALPGTGVEAPGTDKPATELDYLKQIADNTKGGLL